MTEIDLTPVTRLEYDIDAILNDHAVAEPITRIELILADIVAGNTTTVEPVTRIETYLAIISGADYPVPEPVTRIETFLAIIAGEDYETPEAVTRLEGLLAEWVEKGSGIWKTVTGTLLHITDALASPMQKCEVSLEPIQDLHGQDAPYPAGGGKNKAAPYSDTSFWIEDGYINTNGIIIADANYKTSDYISVIPSAGYCFSSSTSGKWLGVYQYDSEKNKLTSAGLAQSSSGVVTITTSAETKYVLLYVQSGADELQFEKGSSRTTFQPYSNICPITGWTGCEVNVTGKQLFNKATATLGVRLDNNGIEVPDANYFTSSFIRVELNSSYVKNSPTADAYHRFAKYSADKSFLSVQNGNLLTTYTDIYYIKFTGLISEINTAQFEKGTTPTEYESFGTTLSVTFGANNLPSEYKEVEYVESTGTQYIDTGIECTSDLVVEFKAKCSSAENTALCGGINSSNSPVLFRHHFTPYNDNVYWIQNDSSNNAAIGHSGVSTSDIVMSVDPTNGTAVINGANKTFTALPNNLTTGKSYGLFGRISNSGVIQTRAGRIYYFKFYRNSQLIGDFVPCYRKSDNVIGMYDKVTESFFTNDGTGEFLKGDYKAVYGCTLDLVSGVLTVDMAEVDLGTLNWVYQLGTYNRMAATNQRYIKPCPNKQKANIVCSMYETRRFDDYKDKSIAITADSSVCVFDDNYSDPTVFKTAMSGVQLVYELTTPIEIQLTPQQISTLKGENNVWSNSNGDTTIIYKAQAE